MKVFTNTNFATGKADGDIKANHIVGLSATSGHVIQAVAATIPIGVSHNYDTDDGCPVTVLPLGAGFARVVAGESLDLEDLGKAVGADAKGRAVTSPTNAIGILAGLSADVEGAVSAVAGDEVVVLLTGVGASGGDPAPTKGKAKFTALDDTTPEKGVTVTITVGDQPLSNDTDEMGVVEFSVEAGTYTWTAAKDGKTITPATDSVTIVAGQTSDVALAVS